MNLVRRLIQSVARAMRLGSKPACLDFGPDFDWFSLACRKCGTKVVIGRRPGAGAPSECPHCQGKDVEVLAFPSQIG